MFKEKGEELFRALHSLFDAITGLNLSVTVGRVSTARLLGMCGNHG
jgi:hypothetical protein